MLISKTFWIVLPDGAEFSFSSAILAKVRATVWTSYKKQQFRINYHEKKTQVNSITHPPDLENLRYASGSPLVLPYGLIINIQNMFIEYL